MRLAYQRQGLDRSLQRFETGTHHSLESPKAHLLPLLQDEHHELQAFSLHEELPAPVT